MGTETPILGKRENQEIKGALSLIDEMALID